MVELTDLLREIREIKTSVGKVENIVERRLIGVEEPSKDELRAIITYEKLKKDRQAEYITLEEALRPVGRKLLRASRKASS